MDIPKDEQKNYPVPGKDGEFYAHKLDIDNAKTYASTDFLGACFDMGIIKDSDGETITHLFGRG